jgi:hypothetical protein
MDVCEHELLYVTNILRFSNKGDSRFLEKAGAVLLDYTTLHAEDSSIQQTSLVYKQHFG